MLIHICKVQNGKIETIYFVLKFRSYFSRYKADLAVLYLWFPLFQDQWDRCDQYGHPIWNCLVKEHHLYSRT